MWKLGEQNTQVFSRLDWGGPYMSGRDSAFLPCCRFSECTTYKLEGGNHLNEKQSLQLPTQARAVRTTEKRFWERHSILPFTFVHCPSRTFSWNLTKKRKCRDALGHFYHFWIYALRTGGRGRQLDNFWKFMKKKLF